jgi:hypothetical protein
VTDSNRGMRAAGVTGWRGWGQFKQFKEIGSQTYLRADIGRQRLSRPLATPGEVEASCVFRAVGQGTVYRLLHRCAKVKQHDFKMLEGDS